MELLHRSVLKRIKYHIPSVSFEQTNANVDCIACLGLIPVSCSRFGKYPATLNRSNLPKAAVIFSCNSIDEIIAAVFFKL